MADTSPSRFAGAADSTRVATAEPPREQGGLALGRQLLRPRTLISFAVSFAIIAFVFARQDIPFSQVWANIRQTNLALYLLGFASYYATFYVRTLRWKQVLRNAVYSADADVEAPSTPRLTRIIVLSWFANTILPAKLGDGYRGYLLKRASNVSFYKAMGTILAERIADVGMLFSLLVLSGLLAFRDQLPPHFGTLVMFGAALSAVSLSVLFLLKYLGPWLARILPSKVRPMYGRLEQGVLLAFRQRLSFIMLLTLLVWGLESARFWFVAASLGVHFGVFLAVFVALAASLLTTVPITPAGLGVVESAVIAVLLLVIHDKSLAGSIALLDRTITYWSLLVVGAVVYLFSRDK